MRKKNNRFDSLKSVALCAIKNRSRAVARHKGRTKETPLHRNGELMSTLGPTSARATIHNNNNNNHVNGGSSSVVSAGGGGGPSNSSGGGGGGGAGGGFLNRSKYEDINYLGYGGEYMADCDSIHFTNPVPFRLRHWNRVHFQWPILWRTPVLLIDHSCVRANVDSREYQRQQWQLIDGRCNDDPWSSSACWHYSSSQDLRGQGTVR